MAGNEFAPSSLSEEERAELKKQIYAAAFVAQYLQVGESNGYQEAIGDVPRIHDESEAIADIWEEYAG